MPRAQTTSCWHSPSTWVRKAARRRAQFCPPPRFGRLTIETLEDRQMPSGNPTLGNLLEFAGDYTSSGSQYTFTTTTAQLGLMPTSGKSFTPLVQIVIPAESKLFFDTSDSGDPKFTLSGGKLTSISNQELANLTASTSFDVKQLTGSIGAPIKGDTISVVSVLSIDITNIALLNPANDTDQSVINLGGNLDLSIPDFSAHIPLSFKGIKAVGAPSIDNTGAVSLEGGGLPANKSFDLAGVTIDASNLTMTYDSVSINGGSPIPSGDFNPQTNGLSLAPNLQKVPFTRPSTSWCNRRRPTRSPR
jgi:hypothetical protein